MLKCPKCACLKQEAIMSNFNLAEKYLLKAIEVAKDIETKIGANVELARFYYGYPVKGPQVSFENGKKFFSVAEKLIKNNLKNDTYRIYKLGRLYEEWGFIELEVSNSIEMIREGIQKLIIARNYYNSLSSIFPWPGLINFLNKFIEEPTCKNLIYSSQKLPSNIGIFVGVIYDDGGDPILKVWFKYGETASYNHETPKRVKYSVGLFCEAIHNLIPNHTYHYRMIVENSKGIYVGDDKIFKPSF